jgi:hypothetical protein
MDAGMAKEVIRLLNSALSVPVTVTTGMLTAALEHGSDSASDNAGAYARIKFVTMTA